MPGEQPVYWELKDIADDLGVALDTARTYQKRATRNRRQGTVRPGDLPPPDAVFGGRPVWLPATIKAWKAQRPGQGVGGGRPHRGDAASP